MSITPLPTPPSRSDSSNFATRADQFLGALPTFVDQLNSYIPAINTASDASEFFLALANFKGKWSDLTGSYQVPSSVYHNQKFWALLTDLSDITTSEPGVSTDWAEAYTPGDDSESRSSSSDITLNSDDVLVQEIEMLSPDLSVTLPAGSSISSGFSFFIVNSGDYDFLIKDVNGNVVGFSQPNKISICLLINNNTTSGSWSITNIDRQNKYLNIFVGFDELFNLGRASYSSVTTLTSSKVLVTYRDEGESDIGRACVLDVTGSNINAGQEFTFETGVVLYTSVIRLTDTKAVLCYKSGDDGKACILDVSGTNITAGSKITFTTNKPQDISVTSLTDLKAIVAYRSLSLSDQGTACILDISGSTITAGSEVNFQSGLVTNTSITDLDSNKAIVAYNHADGFGRSCVLSVSGSIITPGSPSTFISEDVRYVSITSLTDSKALVCFRDNSGTTYLTACLLEVSDLTVTAGSNIVLDSYGAASDISVSSLSSDKAVVCFNILGGVGSAKSLNILGSDIFFSDSTDIKTNNVRDILTSKIDNNKAIVCYSDDDNSLYGTTNILIPIQ